MKKCEDCLHYNGPTDICVGCSWHSLFVPMSVPLCAGCGSSKNYCEGCVSGSHRLEPAPVSHQVCNACGISECSGCAGGADRVESPEYTGGSVSYYTVRVERPTSGGYPYDAECNDIIEALGMNYAEGNVFKAVWRRCAARQGKAKAGYSDGLYDAEKVVFFGQRMVEMERGKK